MGSGRPFLTISSQTFQFELKQAEPQHSTGPLHPLPPYMVPRRRILRRLILVSIWICSSHYYILITSICFYHHSPKSIYIYILYDSKSFYPSYHDIPPPQWTLYQMVMKNNDDDSQLRLIILRLQQLTILSDISLTSHQINLMASVINAPSHIIPGTTGQGTTLNPATSHHPRVPCPRFPGWMGQ